MIQLDRSDVLLVVGALFGSAAAIEDGDRVEADLFRQIASTLLNKWGYTPEEVHAIVAAGLMGPGTVNLNDIPMSAKYAVAVMISVPREIEAGRLDAVPRLFREAASGVLQDWGYTAEEVDSLMKAQVSVREEGFPLGEAVELIAQCRGRCCLCHEGPPKKRVKVAHIVSLVEGGSNSIENAIVVCTDCRREIHVHRVDRGIPFTPEELRGHREQWLAICRKVSGRN